MSNIGILIAITLLTALGVGVYQKIELALLKRRNSMTTYLYSVTWAREYNPDEVLECHKLTPEKLAHRLEAAIRNSGPIRVVSVSHRKST